VPRSHEPHAEDGVLSPVARLAAGAVSGALAEAKTIRVELVHGGLGDLLPHAVHEAVMSIDDVPNPFAGADPDLADKCLRRLGPRDRVEHLILHERNTCRPTWDDYVYHAGIRAFEAAREAAMRHGAPGLAVFGEPDGLGQAERIRAIGDCLRTRKPFVAVDAIDEIDNFLAVHNSALWASAAIAASGPGDVAVAVATGTAVAVTSCKCGFVSLDGDPWFPIDRLGDMPELIRSYMVPLAEPALRNRFLKFLGMPEPGTIFGISGNAMILNGVVLGGTGAGFQPSGYALDACVAPVAAAAGRTVTRADRPQETLSTEQLHSLLLNALARGERLPGLVIARHEMAARQLARKVRKHPA